MNLLSKLVRAEQDAQRNLNAAIHQLNKAKAAVEKEKKHVQGGWQRIGR
jgi:hypothetical protein